MTSHTSAQMGLVEVSSRWDAVLDGAARATLERALPSYIAARRWYRTKTKRVQSARITAAFPLVFGAEVARIALVEVVLDDGGRDTYVVPLAFVHGEGAARMRDRRAHALVSALRVVGALPAGAGGSKKKTARQSDVLEGFIVDGLAVEGVLAEILAAMARNTSVEEGGLTLRFHAIGHVREQLEDRTSRAATAARLVDREQTNTSVIFGDRFVGKVVRKLDPGESADLEMGRFLTAVGFAHTPALEGWIDVQRGNEAPSTVGLLHALVANKGDAWEHVLGVLDGWLTAAATRDSGPPKWSTPPGITERVAGDVLTRASQPLPPEVESAMGPYAALAQTLGRRVGEMHVALASRPDDAVFAPEPLDRATRAQIVATASTDLVRVLETLGARGGELPDAARTSLAAVRRRSKSFAARLGAIADAEDAGVKIRVHGDLHLGQVLFTGSDFALIDFEGEPARPIEERKAKRSPLVDVAGMLRSFHYAAVSALRAQPEGSRAALAPWASFWHRAATAMFLRGWLSAAGGTVVVPSEPATTRALLDLFVLEKGIYEVGYEMNNRPDWVEIPLEGLREIIAADERAAPAEVALIDGDGAHEWAAPVTLPSPTHPSVVTPPDRVVVIADDQVTRSMLDPSSPAVMAFSQGKATHAFALLGAHPHQDGATDFAVWAPHAARVSVIGDFNDWSADSAVLLPVEKTGIFAGHVRGARAGHRYKYRIVTADGAVDKADPFAITSEPSPGNASVVGTLTYAWSDGTWMENRVQHARLDLPMSIYEVHLGSWRRPAEQGDRMLGYREIAGPLAAHAKAMGFTHVELMPLMEHPFYGSWGYGVTGFFAATSRYGSPADLMYLVDTLHQAGIGVIFDWVPAHFARDPHGLAAFDGAAQFEPADPTRAVHPTWETGLFDYAKPEVRSFLLSSAMYWIETFHADGLRIDGVESILYEGGTGGPENKAGVDFLRELTSTLKIEHPEVVLAAEDSSAWPGVTRAASAGGLGFDLKWDMGFSHDLRRYLAIDPAQRSQHQDALTFRSVYAKSESFVLPLAHDDVVEERGGSLLQQMHGDDWQSLANLRLLYAMTWAQPGKKLLFMGDEFAQARPWHHDRSLDWHTAQEPRHDGIARMVGDLNRVYRDVSALHAGDATPGGFEWIDGSNAEMSVIAFVRKGRGDDDVALVVVNFTPVPRHQYRVGVPKSGHYREIFNSDAREYGGSGHGNLGGVDAVPYPWNGRPASVVLTLPPLGALILTR